MVESFVTLAANYYAYHVCTPAPSVTEYNMWKKIQQGEIFTIPHYAQDVTMFVHGILNVKVLCQ
jgi:hypothetical protein